MELIQGLNIIAKLKKDNSNKKTGENLFFFTYFYNYAIITNRKGDIYGRIRFRKFR